MNISVNDIINKGTCDIHPELLKKFIAVEECAELIQAVTKVVRSKVFGDPGIDERIDNEAEEMADVYLILETLKYIDGISDEDVQTWIDYKQKRQAHRDYDYITKTKQEVSKEYMDIIKEIIAKDGEIK